MPCDRAVTSHPTRRTWSSSTGRSKHFGPGPSWRSEASRLSSGRSSRRNREHVLPSRLSAIQAISHSGGKCSTLSNTGPSVGRGAMADLAGFAATTFIAIFAIVNPIGAMTFFVVLTRSYPPIVKKRVIEKAVLAATVTLLIFAFVGNNIFLFFGTSIPAFRIAGGILLFSIAFSMMQGERSRTQLTAQDRQEALEREAIGIVPLGIPMLAGPGAITTVIVLMAEATSPALDTVRIVVILASILVTMAVAWLMLTYADRIFHRVGRMGAYAISRIMGLILAAIAVQFVILGIQGAIAQYFLP